MAKQTWDDGWADRIYRSARAKGFSSLRALAGAMPSSTFNELAAVLEVDAAPVQIQDLLYQEAIEHDQYADFVRDTLVRCIRRHTSKGWGRAPAAEQRHAFAAFGQIVRIRNREDLMRAWQLMGNEDLQLDWCPEGAEDPVILRVTAPIIENQG